MPRPENGLGDSGLARGVKSFRNSPQDFLPAQWMIWRFVMGRRILLLVCLASCVCASAVAQDNTKPGAGQSTSPDQSTKAGSADSEEFGCSSGPGWVAQPGKPTTAMTPIFGEIVISPCPEGFHGAYQKTNGGHYTLEMVLKGETVDHWTQMVTVTGLQGHSTDPNATARTRLDPIANGFRHACPDSFAAKPLGYTTISGHEAYVAWISCGSTTHGGSAHSESALIVSIKGTEDYYTVQWAESGPASSQPLAFDEAKWEDRLEKMTPMKVCPGVPGESMPYPSCLKQKPVTTIPEVTPVFSELVRFTPPEGFDIALEETKDTHYTREMVPEGETSEIWAQMVTLKAEKGLSADPKSTPQPYLEKFASNFRGVCPDTFATKVIGPTTISGHEAYGAWLSCGTLTSGSSPYGSSFLIVAIKGTNDFYRILWAERGPASSQPIVFDEVKWADRLKKLNTIKICAMVPGEAAPYPSCTDQK
jgi:hypothetical protein